MPFGAKITTTFPTATIGAFSKTFTPQGELSITGVYKGVQIAQTLTIDPPCLLFLEPVNGNLNAVHDIRQVQPNWEFVEIIQKVEEEP